MCNLILGLSRRKLILSRNAILENELGNFCGVNCFGIGNPELTLEKKTLIKTPIYLGCFFVFFFDGDSGFLICVSRFYTL